MTKMEVLIQPLGGELGCSRCCPCSSPGGLLFGCLTPLCTAIYAEFHLVFLFHLGHLVPVSPFHMHLCTSVCLSCFPTTTLGWGLWLRGLLGLLQVRKQQWHRFAAFYLGKAKAWKASTIFLEALKWVGTIKKELEVVCRWGAHIFE